MSSHFHRQRRVFLAGLATTIAASAAYGQAQPEGVNNKDLSILLLDGMGNTISDAVIDIFGDKGHARLWEEENRPGEYKCNALEGAMTICFKRKLDSSPELLLNRLWGPEDHRVVVSLPGGESIDSELERLSNALSAVETLILMQTLNVNLKRFYEESKLDAVTAFFSVSRELAQFDMAKTDAQVTFLKLLRRKVSIVGESPIFTP